MTGKVFMNSLMNGQADIIQIFSDMLNTLKIDYCLIGGLAVNAYAESASDREIAGIFESNRINPI